MSQVERVDRDSVDITVKHKSGSRYAQGSYFELLLIDLFNFAVPPENNHIQIVRLAYHMKVAEFPKLALIHGIPLSLLI